ncbi:hypothetical protein AAZX31_03G228300 [Glycine max]|uniref:VQ domain-containing protein n=2 Tax=Glycine subgen. Soja TaxID=1462606 RepID=K7KGX9_SOYBN|nr:hypothetical protein GmHk_03G008922 [Glycine max]KHN31482.1 hypothetical protein glysoja_035589 [Glycine soja]KRH68769.1 hypothetical protein GLYMA_03G249100v4 [Glycine max]RZC22385.1 hypothetical protein D0Y65_008167 [Glycine soja]
MGKLRYDPNCYHHKEANTLKTMQKNPKKTVKITYISNPVLVRACDASEFRSVVQQLTGKDTNKKVETPRKEYNSTLMQQRVMQREDAGNGLYHYNGSMMTSLELDEDYYWKELARSLLPSPSCVVLV